MDDKIGLQLKGMSVRELEDLRERVAKELTAKLTSQVDFKSFSFEAPDDRSMGSLKFEAQTKHGLLRYSSFVGNGYSDGTEVSLDGADDGSDGLDCLEVPNFHDDTDEDDAKRECAKAVLAFEDAYEEYLNG